LRKEVQPLLDVVLAVSSVPGEVPSGEFIRRVERRLAERHAETLSLITVETPVARGWGIAPFLENIVRAVVPLRRVAVPVALALVLVIAASFGAVNFLSPSSALASQCTLSLLSGSVQYQEPGSAKWQSGTDGIVLAAGTRIRTSSDSHALLTFFEGSTLRLEADTDVEIREIERGEQQTTVIVLKQWTGRTWSRVVKMTDQGSRYEIETPTAVAAVRGTLFTTAVDETGSTEVATTSGLVSVMAQGEEVLIPPKQKTHVSAGKAPTPPETADAPGAEIVISVDRNAVVSVIDPTGASTGYLPGGIEFNQIPGSESASTPSGHQRITINEPVSGEYTVILRYTKEGTASVSMQGTSDGKLAFGYGGEYQGTSESSWLIRFNLQVDGGMIVSSDISGMGPLDIKTHEKIVITEETAQPAGEKNNDNNQGSDNRGQDQGEGQGQGNEKDNEGDKGGEQGNGQGGNNAPSPDKGSAQGINIPAKNPPGENDRSKPGQEQDPNQGLSGSNAEKDQDQSPGQGQGDKDEKSDKGQDQNPGQGQGDRDEKGDKGQDQSPGQGQGDKDEKSDKGQDQSPGQGQGDKDEKSDKGQDQSPGQGQSDKDEKGDKGQDQSPGQGQGSDTDKNGNSDEKIKKQNGGEQDKDNESDEDGRKKKR